MNYLEQDFTILNVHGDDVHSMSINIAQNALQLFISSYELNLNSEAS